MAHEVCKTCAMSIRVLAVGKRHEDWVADGITRYEKRLKKPYELNWQLLPHSAREGDAARAEESERVLAKIDRDEYLIVLDERGKNLSSPKLAETLSSKLSLSARVTCIIGGAYGVSDELRTRADLVWSLSHLVFPHQLVRLVLTEQIYRAQEITAGRPYHHD